jgi:hypothetical protein
MKKLAIYAFGVVRSARFAQSDNANANLQLITYFYYCSRLRYKAEARSLFSAAVACAGLAWPGQAKPGQARPSQVKINFSGGILRRLIQAITFQHIVFLI